MKFLIVIAALILSLPAWAELEIKNLVVDKKLDCAYLETLEVRKGRFFNSCENKSPEFFTKISFLDKTADMFVHQTLDGNLKALLLINFNFELAQASLLQKFGEGVVEKSTLQNRMGASFEQIVVTWKDGTSQLRLTKHGAKLNEPSLWLTGEEWRNQTQEKLKPSKNL